MCFGDNDLTASASLREESNILAFQFVTKPRFLLTITSEAKEWRPGVVFDFLHFLDRMTSDSSQLFRFLKQKIGHHSWYFLAIEI
jgi:hypothetical protein